MQGVYFEWVILIDDDFASNYYHRIIIEESGLVNRVEQYSEAKEVLKLFEVYSKDGYLSLPDLIFLDINMPIINGWEFLEKLKLIHLAHYPDIVILSTSANPKDKEKSESYDLVLEFLTKPLKKEDLEKLYDLKKSK